MIVDNLKNAALYYGISPRLKKAFELMAATDWSTVEPGIHELDGRDIYVNVMERELKTKEAAKIEVHNDYIDIQLLVKGDCEQYGWSERGDLKQPQSEFNTTKDVQFFDDAPQTYYTLRPGQFTLVFPEDAHAPLVGEGTVKKAVFKVRL